MNNKFTVNIRSDLDFEEMVADISFNNYTIAMISRENGVDQMEIEIFTPKDLNKNWKFSLDEFVNILVFAKRRLIEMKKLPE